MNDHVRLRAVADKLGERGDRPGRPGALDPSGRIRAFDESQYSFVESCRPVVELNQLEAKAAGGIELDPESRFYSRMRAARRPDAKYIRNERISDGFYRLDEDHGEHGNRVGAGLEAELEAALAAFGAPVAGARGDGTAGQDVLADVSDDAQDRRHDLGDLR